MREIQYEIVKEIAVLLRATVATQRKSISFHGMGKSRSMTSAAFPRTVKSAARESR